MNIPDINYEIIRKLHPYYNLGFCSINKINLKICQEAMYELLHIWSYPQLSIRQIKSKYPKLDYNDVVNICLLYNPIPESLLYFDPYSCFYYACLRKQTIVSNYILLNNEYLYDNSVLWICYRFLRLDVLETILESKSLNNDEEDLLHSEIISNLKLFINMVRLKLKLDVIYPRDNDNILDIMERALMFNNEELIELFTLSQVVSSIGLYFPYLLGEPTPEDPYELKIYRFVNTVASKVPLETINSIVKTYIPNINVPPISYVKDGSFELGTGILGPVALYKDHSYIDKCIPINDRGLYYLTSGLIGEYRSWLRDGYNINKIDEKYYGINPFGDLTLDTKLIDMLEISFEDTSYYPINNIYRRYDCKFPIYSNI